MQISLYISRIRDIIVIDRVFELDTIAIFIIKNSGES